MTPEHKKFIDEAPFVQLFRLWRFAEIGNELLIGDTGNYFAKVMAEKRNKITPENYVRISKQIGW